MTLADALVDPRTAFDAMRSRSNALAAIAMLTLAMIGGSLLQAPVVNRASANALQSSFDAGNGASLSADERARLVRNAEDPGLSAEIVNPLIYVTMVVTAIGLETVLAWLLVALCGGRPELGSFFSALLSIGVWSIGLYYIVSSIMVRVAFSLFDRVIDSEALFPSALMLFHTTDHGALARGALAAINPFLVLGIVLHVIAFLVLGRIGRVRAAAIACVLACAEVVTSGLMSSVFG